MVPFHSISFWILVFFHLPRSNVIAFNVLPFSTTCKKHFKNISQIRCNNFQSKSLVSRFNRHQQQLTLSAKQSFSYASACSPSVDMNQYNLPLSRSIQEWAAVVSPRTSLSEGGIFLQPKNKRDLFVDRLQFSVKREGGLGLILTEIAGGREDGVGITIIEEVLKGGNSEPSGIEPGDSIVALTVKRKATIDGLKETEDRIDVSTECLGYDSTVEALQSLPPPESSEEELVLTIKRLRKQPRIKVNLQYPNSQSEPDTTLELFAGENLRRALLTRGIQLNDKLAERFDSGGTGDCGAEGTCATCVVSVTKGIDLLSPAKIQEAQILKKKPRWRMACKAVVGWGMKEGEMTIQVNPRQH